VALYITLCGNIGVGKTTLAGIMAERWRWQLFQESVEDHPYLADYYADRPRWALASQLVFLERTFRQQLTITRGEVNSVQERSAAENYMVFARTLFEEAILSPREFGTLSDLYYLLEDAVRPADLLVYLRASEDTLLDRITLRGRSYESGGVDRDYLAALNRSYDRFYREYQIGPKLEINMNDFDIALRPSDSAEVLRQIAGATGYDPELVLF
jgi:deoxyadenosine/deoxycytidine kinase